MISGKLVIGVGLLSLVGAAIGFLLALNEIEVGRHIGFTLVPIGSNFVFAGAIATLTGKIKP